MWAAWHTPEWKMMAQVTERRPLCIHAQINGSTCRSICLTDPRLSNQTGSTRVGGRPSTVDMHRYIGSELQIDSRLVYVIIAIVTIHAWFHGGHVIFRIVFFLIEAAHSPERRLSGSPSDQKILFFEKRSTSLSNIIDWRKWMGMKIKKGSRK